jgi:hypothetical protein
MKQDFKTVRTTKTAKINGQDWIVDRWHENVYVWREGERVGSWNADTGEHDSRSFGDWPEGVRLCVQVALDEAAQEGA